jgi:hypothetical protein
MSLYSQHETSRKSSSTEAHTPDMNKSIHVYEHECSAFSCCGGAYRWLACLHVVTLAASNASVTPSVLEEPCRERGDARPSKR